MDLVSVVIPTRRRPALLARAVASVLSQTHDRLEVVVVVDGPDRETVERLGHFNDSRLRVVELASSRGGSLARNAGVAAARGDWVAFLDDDDDWLPEKLERQLAQCSVTDDVLVTCRIYAVTARATFVWPRRLHDGAMPIGDYLFDRRSLLKGETFLQTSTFLLPRRLAERVPFRPVTRHEDWDFLLRLLGDGRVRLVSVPEPLIRYHTDDHRPSVGQGGTWRESLAWIDSVRDRLSRRAYSGFCTTVVLPRALASGGMLPALRVLARAFRRGTPTPIQLAVFLSIWWLPDRLRTAIRARRFGVRPVEV